MFVCVSFFMWFPSFNFLIISGTVAPYEYAIALAENAADNGVDIRLRHVVTAIEKPDSSTSPYVLTVQQWKGEGPMWPGKKVLLKT